MWYTVQPGDSLYSIAKRFGAQVESILALNNLTSIGLVVGQRILIPLYTEVQVITDYVNIRQWPDENAQILATMVRGARLPLLSSIRDWHKVRLYNGRDGWIPKSAVNSFAYGGRKPISLIVGFYTLEEGPGLPSSFQSFVSNTAVISELALFMFRISAANPTQIEKFGNFSDQDVTNLVAIAHRNNIKIMPVVHNLLYRPGGTELARNTVKQLVSTQENRNAFAQNLVRLIERYGFDGVNIDIEDAFKEDYDGLSLLYAEIGHTLHRKGYFFSASVPSRITDQPINPFSNPFNYAAIGRSVDQFIAMLYNEHGWPGSGPGPVVSIGWMEKVLNYAITKMPSEKIVGAVSVFGFDFNLTTGKNTYVTYKDAVELAKKYNKQITFDQPTQTPMFAYEDEQGNKHEVWFENAASIYAKIKLAWDLGVSGIALWRLGLEDPAIWTMLARDVVVRKY